MRKSIFYKWFGAGRLPDQIRGEIASETVLFETDGLHVDFDLDAVDPRCHGKMKVHFRQSLSGADLARFPNVSLGLRVFPDKVISLFKSG